MPPNPGYAIHAQSGLNRRLSTPDQQALPLQYAWLLQYSPAYPRQSTPYMCWISQAMPPMPAWLSCGNMLQSTLRHEPRADAVGSA